MPDTTISTTLLESVNIVLANLGEAPVNSLSGNALPQQVSLALNTIEEVSTDIQSKGWWFNQQSGGNFDTTANIVIYPSNSTNDWSSNIPEEARRYITIRASRIAQTRLIGSEELQKFSYNEELVSLAILQQAQVRNSNGVLDFNSFPSELRSLGIDEVMFLQKSAEEKLLSLRLKTELKTADKVVSETGVANAQSALIYSQLNTEIQETYKRAAEKALIDAQELKTDAEKLLVDEQAGLITNQAATELKKALDLVADTTIKGKQGSLIDKQALTEVQNALKVIAETSLINDQEALIVKQALTEVAKANDLGADTTLKGKQGSLIDNQAATELKRALDLVADTTIKGKQGSLIDNQAATELKNALKVVAETSLLNDQEALVVNQAATELKKALDIAADTTLKGKQGSLIDNQAATELKRALDLVADTTLKGKQGSFIDNQAATELKQALKLVAETSLIADQEALVVNQAATELKKALDIAADTTLKTKQGALVDAQAIDVAADTTLKGKQGSLVDAQATDVAADTTLKGKQGSLVDAQATDVAADTTLKGKQGSLVDAQATDVAADTTLKGKQGSLVDAQATDVAADTTLKGKQGSLVEAQTTTETSQQGSLDAQATKFTGEGTLATNQAALVTAQKDQLLAQTAIEVTAEKAFYDGVVAGTQDTYRDYAAEMRIMGIQESDFTQTPAYKKIELLKDAVKLRTVSATETSQNSNEIEQVNKVLRFIGEPPVSTLGDHALSSETARLLRDTDAELQGRGWWFNTHKNVEFEPDGGIIPLEDVVLSIEVDGIPTHISRYGSGYRLFNRDANSTTSWTSTIKATVIYKKSLSDVPTKYLEYLNVRTAILLTELYPQSGIDIQRLPKMEQELRAYFKDRQNDEANYTVFDNYDAASIIGINRNHSII